jgi:hypothetical protein
MAEWEGFSRGLKNSPPDCFSRRCRRPFRIPPTEYRAEKTGEREDAFSCFLASGYEKDGFAGLTDGFEPSKVFSDIAFCDGSDIVPAGK